MKKAEKMARAKWDCTVGMNVWRGLS